MVYNHCNEWHRRITAGLQKTLLACRLGFDEIKSASELCTAAAQGKVDLIRHYIKGGINVDAADYDKRTALHIAAADGCLDAVSPPPLSSHLADPLHPSLKTMRPLSYSF